MQRGSIFGDARGESDEFRLSLNVLPVVNEKLAKLESRRAARFNRIGVPRSVNRSVIIMDGSGHRAVPRRKMRQLQIHFSISGKLRQQIKQVGSRLIWLAVGGQRLREMKLIRGVLRLKDQCVAIIVASIAGMPSREARVAQLEPVFSYRLLLQVERAGEETCHREERNQKHGAEEQHGLARKPGTHSVKSLFLRISHRG